MTDSFKKTISLTLRVSPDQEKLLRQGYKQYLIENTDRLTFSEFCRRQLMLQTLKILKVVEMGHKKETCACIEVHTCGKSND